MDSLIELIGKGARSPLIALPFLPQRDVIVESLDLLHESARDPHPPTPSPKMGEGEPEIGGDSDLGSADQVPLPSRERDLTSVRVKPTTRKPQNPYGN